MAGASLPKNFEGFVYAKWLKSLKHGNDFFKLADNDTYYGAYKKFINEILQRPATTLRFAILPDDRDTLLGFSVTQGTTLHYVFVQYEQRNQGIAKALVPKGIQSISHLTKSGMGFWHSQLPKAVFNPFQ